MIYDEHGQIISKGSPSMLDLSKSVTRDPANYGEYPWMVSPSSLGHMSYKLLRNIYQISSAVRPAVDSISRELSTLPWMVINKDYKYHDPSELADIIEFLEYPNLDDEDLSAILSKFITDMLVVGKGCIEKVRSGQGKLLELVARDAALFEPKLNSMGFIIGYVEYDKNSFLPKMTHKKENIIFKYFTPLSYTFGSAPIIETIVNEVALLMLCVKAIAWAFTRDEIPPGVLHLGIIGEEALERAKASFEATKGIIGQSKIRVVDNVDKVDWVQFTRPFREQQTAELMPMIERIVARNFGLSPVESSLSDVARGVAESSFKSSQSKLVFPFMQMLKGSMNRQVIRELDKDALFIYSRIPQEDFDKRSEALGKMLDRGLITDNEARMPLGFSPVQGGDSRSVKLGNERVPLDPKTGLPKYRNSVNPGQKVVPVAKKDLDE